MGIFQLILIFLAVSVRADENIEPVAEQEFNPEDLFIGLDVEQALKIPSNLVKLTSLLEFIETVQSAEVAVAFFYFPRSAPCRAIAVELETIADFVASNPLYSKRVSFVRYNPFIDEEYLHEHHEVTSVPQVNFYLNGFIVKTFNDVIYADRIYHIVTRLLMRTPLLSPSPDWLLATSEHSGSIFAFFKDLSDKSSKSFVKFYQNHAIDYPEVFSMNVETDEYALDDYLTAFNLSPLEIYEILTPTDERDSDVTDNDSALEHLQPPLIFYLSSKRNKPVNNSTFPPDVFKFKGKIPTKEFKLFLNRNRIPLFEQLRGESSVDTYITARKPIVVLGGTSQQILGNLIAYEEIAIKYRREVSMTYVDINTKEVDARVLGMYSFPSAVILRHDTPGFHPFKNDAEFNPPNVDKWVQDFLSGRNDKFVQRSEPIPPEEHTLLKTVVYDNFNKTIQSPLYDVVMILFVTSKEDEVVEDMFKNVAKHFEQDDGIFFGKYNLQYNDKPKEKLKKIAAYVNGRSQIIDFELNEVSLRYFVEHLSSFKVEL